VTGPTDTLIPQQLAATVQLGSRTVGRDVLTGIRDASLKTGVDFAYMLAKANQESGLQPDAVNGRSTASGLFQFTRQTWLDMVRTHGAKHGLGDVARQIEMDGRGRLGLADPQAEADVLSLRRNPRVSAIMAAEYALQNKSYLEHMLGRPASTTDIYLAHFLGPAGATTFLSASARFPDRPAADLLPEAARQNAALFYQGGRPRTLGELHRLLHATIDDAMRHFAGAETLTQGPPPPPPGAKPAPPPPEDMGATRTADAGPPRSPGAKPLPPGYEDMGAIRTAEATAPIPPGLKPPPPPPEDMGATRVADAGPPVPPGAKPYPDGTPAGSPPRPESDPETRIAGAADPGLPPAGPPTDGETVIARILSAARAVEHASAARGLSLPGGSAAAVAALLDTLTQTSPDADGTVGVVRPLPPGPSAPHPLAGPPADNGDGLPGHQDRDALSYMALAQTARGLFAPNAAPWSAPASPSEAAPSDTPSDTQSDTTDTADAGAPTPVEPAPSPAAPAPSAEPVAAGDGDAPDMPASEAPTAVASVGTPQPVAGMRPVPAGFLSDAEAARAIAAILGRPRSG
jgi:hypothetical protein